MKKIEKSNKSTEYDKNNDDDDEDLDYIPRKKPASEIKDSDLSPGEFIYMHILIFGFYKL
jgi:hypothetical protein